MCSGFVDGKAGWMGKESDLATDLVIPASKVTTMAFPSRAKPAYGSVAGA